MQANVQQMQEVLRAQKEARAGKKKKSSGRKRRPEETGTSSRHGKRHRLIDEVDETPTLTPPPAATQPGSVLADPKNVGIFRSNWNITKSDSALGNFHISKEWVERSILPVDASHTSPLPSSQIMNVTRDLLYSLTAHSMEVMHRLETSGTIISKQEDAIRTSEEERSRLKRDLQKLKDAYHSKKKEISSLKDGLKAAQEAEATAVARYMKSPEGQKEIATLGATSLVQGFKLCKQKIREEFPEFPEDDLSRIQLEGAESDDEEEAEDEETAPKESEQRMGDGDDNGDDEVMVVGEKSATRGGGEKDAEDGDDVVEKAQDADE